MAEPNTQTSSPLSASDTLASVSAEADRLDALDFMNTASETASEIYSQANSWLDQNRRTVYLGAALIVAGVVGYMIGRSASGNSDTEKP